MTLKNKNTGNLSVSRCEVKYLLSLPDRLFLLDALNRLLIPDDMTAKFELKRKSFGRELKESIVISREDAGQILNRNYSVLLKYKSPISQYACQLMTTRLYRPVALIEYDRIAFTHENFNTRVTMVF